MPAGTTLPLVVGKNDFLVDINMLHIPDWWMQENGNPSVQFHPEDIRWVEFCAIIDDAHGVVADTLKIQAVDVLVK